ncbi:MAG: BlaI/MecI/CopY family transcriptional regulator [Acutalibacteraceae bacterium]
MKDLTIGEAELEIMKVLWKEKKPVNTQFINKAVEAKGWKRTTISTFLTRLTQKGAVKSEKEGNTYYYEALISEREYRRMKTKNLISTLYGGSVKEFTAALFEDEELSKSDIDELRAFINSLEEK